MIILMQTDRRSTTSGPDDRDDTDSQADGTTADDDAEGRGEDGDETVEQTQTQPFSTAAAVATAATDANSQPAQSMDTTSSREKAVLEHLK